MTTQVWVAIAAVIVTAAIGIATWRQKDRADRRTEWFRRASWAFEQARSSSSKKVQTPIGQRAFSAIAESRSVAKEDAAFAQALWGELADANSNGSSDETAALDLSEGPGPVEIDNDSGEVRAAMTLFRQTHRLFSLHGVAVADGNFDRRATLSTVIVYQYGAAGSSPVHALMFHKGQYIGTATADPYAYLHINKEATTGTTVVLNFRYGSGDYGASDSATYLPILLRWNGVCVEMVGTPPDDYRA